MIRFTKLTPKAHIPTRGSKMAAGYDLYACIDEEIIVAPHETVMVPTGLAIEPPTGTFGAIFPRSGLATKRGLRPANCVGVCDEDYRGQYIVALHNDTDKPQTVGAGERIAQLVFIPYIADDEWIETDLDQTERGAGGFGSTGTH